MAPNRDKTTGKWPPHPATIAPPRAAPRGLPARPPHPATVVIRQTERSLPAWPAAARTVPRVAQRMEWKTPVADDDDPSFGLESAAHAWRRHLVVHLQWPNELATIVISYGMSFARVCAFTVRIEGGKLLPDSQTSHAQHPYALAGRSGGYNVDDWTNQEGGLVAQIQAGFRSVYLSRQMRPDFGDFLHSLASADGRWSDALLARYVLTAGYPARWYEQLNFQLTLRFPLEFAVTDRERFAVHLVYLRVTNYYRDRAMRHFGGRDDVSALLRRMAVFMFDAGALRRVLTATAEESGGTSVKALAQILGRDAKEEKQTGSDALQLFRALMAVPSEGGASRILWNLIVSHILGQNVGDTGGFVGDKKHLNHLRFSLYEEWRTVFELLLVHRGLRQQYARGTVDGRRIINIARDGHCLFRSVARLLGNEDSHVRLRLGVAADEASDVAFAIRAGAVSAKRIADMVKLDENIVWGGEAEIMFLSARINRRIVVHRLHQLPLTFNGFESIGGPGLGDSAGPDIHIYHEGGDHYQALE